MILPVAWTEVVALTTIGLRFMTSLRVVRPAAEFLCRRLKIWNMAVASFLFGVLLYKWRSVLIPWKFGQMGCHPILAGKGSA
jgi:hypothetical protein